MADQRRGARRHRPSGSHSGGRSTSWSIRRRMCSPTRRPRLAAPETAGAPAGHGPAEHEQVQGRDRRPRPVHRGSVSTGRPWCRPVRHLGRRPRHLRPAQAGYRLRLHVFEVDQPARRPGSERLIELGFGVPAWLRLVPVDFEAVCGGSSWPPPASTRAAGGRVLDRRHHVPHQGRRRGHLTRVWRRRGLGWPRRRRPSTWVAGGSTTEGGSKVLVPSRPILVTAPKPLEPRQKGLL